MGRSIFARLLLIMLPAALIPLLALGLVVLRVNEIALSNVSRELRLAIASDARAAVRDELGRAADELTSVGHILLGEGGDGFAGDGRSAQARSIGGEGTARRIEMAGARVTASSLFDAVVVYGVDGKRAGAIKAREAKDPQSPETLDDATLQQLGKGHLVPGQARGEALDVFMPVQIMGVLRGVVFAQLHLKPLCAALGDLGEQRLGSRDAVVILDSRRHVVAAGNESLIGQDFTGRGILGVLKEVSFGSSFGASPEFKDGGREMLGALETIPELSFAAAAAQPRELAYGSLQLVRRSVLAALLLAVVFAALAGILAGRWLTRPVRRLAVATRELAEQKFTGVGPEVAGRSDELGSLGRAFDTMAADLGAARTKLVGETEARASLSRYLSRDVVEMILKEPGRLRMGGERREVTILFSDVVAFTRLTESLPPETVVAILNELFTFATEIVHRRGGIIDKFIGDAVMAVFGTPEQHDDDPLRAVLAADDLRRWLDTANRKWRQQHGIELQLAMGVNTGAAIAGNVGSEKRLEYTVIGDVVNVAARLEGMARPGQILITEAVRAALGEAVAVSPVGETPIAGRTGKVMVYEVLE
ncbi:MAG TPA: adenylate/guanylate cyclase domain-containing protein [Myxococcales bacterium]|jgi:class 3 adenylate cyclase|nr:adenylate/guanylate cyclase domain-containing protein [Myxococcales bacterium]